MDHGIEKRHLKALTRIVQEELQRLGWWQIWGKELLTFGTRLVLFTLGFFIFSLHGIIPKTTGIFILSYAYYGIAITGTHETRHTSFVRSLGWNRVWAFFFSDFWASQSNEWWHYRHVVKHHNYTNIPGKEAANFYYPWLNKYLYFFVIPYLVLFWLIGNSIYYLAHTKNWRELSLYIMCMIAGWIFQIWLFSLLLPLSTAILAVIVMRMIFAPVFMHIAVFNHIGLEDPPTRPPWLPHQTKTTRNLRRHWFLTGMGGNAFIESHLEHHLFPTLSNSVLWRIRPQVKSYLEKNGYRYVEEGYWQVLGDCLRNYESYFAHTSPNI